MRTIVFGIFMLTSAVANAGPIEIVLPGGQPVGMDYLALDSAHGRLWVPAGNTGNVDVIDLETRKVTPIGGFATTAPGKPGRPRMGPSSASVGDGVVWIGNRGDNQICAFDAVTLQRKACIKLEAMPDGVQYVASRHEIWVTTPKDETITISSTLAGGTAPSSLKLPGAPEGYALDEARGVFYTNLEDKDRSLAIDVKTRKVAANWSAGCGSEGPRGVALDATRRILLVACTDGVNALDLSHDGKIVGHLKTGKGVDNIDYLAARRLLYVASRDDGKLSIAKVGDDGALSLVESAVTAPGARNAVVDRQATAYVADSTRGRIIVVPTATH